MRRESLSGNEDKIERRGRVRVKEKPREEENGREGKDIKDSRRKNNNGED